MRREDDEMLAVPANDYEALLDSRTHILQMLQTAEQKLTQCEMASDRWRSRYNSMCRYSLVVTILLALAIVGHVLRSLLR